MYLSDENDEDNDDGRSAENLRDSSIDDDDSVKCNSLILYM